MGIDFTEKTNFDMIVKFIEMHIHVYAQYGSYIIQSYKEQYLNLFTLSQKSVANEESYKSSGR